MTDPTIGRVWGTLVIALLSGRVPSIDELSGQLPRMDDEDAVVEAIARWFDSGNRGADICWRCPLGRLSRGANVWRLDGVVLAPQSWKIDRAYRRMVEREEKDLLAKKAEKARRMLAAYRSNER